MGGGNSKKDRNFSEGGSDRGSGNGSGSGSNRCDSSDSENNTPLSSPKNGSSR